MLFCFPPPRINLMFLSAFSTEPFLPSYCAFFFHSTSPCEYILPSMHSIFIVVSNMLIRQGPNECLPQNRLVKESDNREREMRFIWFFLLYTRNGTLIHKPLYGSMIHLFLLPVGGSFFSLFDRDYCSFMDSRITQHFQSSRHVD